MTVETTMRTQDREEVVEMYICHPLNEEKLNKCKMLFFFGGYFTVFACPNTSTWLRQLPPFLQDSHYKSAG